MLESSNLSRDNLSREIGHMATRVATHTRAVQGQDTSSPTRRTSLGGGAKRAWPQLIAVVGFPWQPCDRPTPDLLASYSSSLMAPFYVAMLRPCLALLRVNSCSHLSISIWATPLISPNAQRVTHCAQRLAKPWVFSRMRGKEGQGFGGREGGLGQQTKTCLTLRPHMYVAWQRRLAKMCSSLAGQTGCDGGTWKGCRVLSFFAKICHFLALPMVKSDTYMQTI